MSRAGVAAQRARVPPIVPVALRGGEAVAVADRLAAALTPMRGRIGNPRWSKSAVELLLTAPDLALMPVRRIAPATKATRAAPSKYPGHALEAWHGLLARSGMLPPDSALLDWPPSHRWRSLATLAALLLVTIGARAVQEYGPSRFRAAAPPQPAATAPDLTADVLARATILPTVGTTLPATMLTLSQLTAPPLKVATLTPPAPPSPQPVVPPQPKPVMPASHTTATKPRPATLRPKIVPQPAAPKNFTAAGDPAASRDGGASAAWYDREATTASNAGLTAFVAPGARNNGLIAANLGTARLATGTTATLDFYGDGLVNIAISGQTLARTIDPSTGKTFGSAVGKTGVLKADAGTVLVAANVAANVVDDVVNTSGVVQAQSASEQNGQIVLNGGASGSGRTVQIADTKAASDYRRSEPALAGNGPLAQGTVYATTTIPVAQDAAAGTNAIATSVGGTVTGAVVQGATDVNAITTSVGTTLSATPTTVAHLGGTVGAVGSALTTSVTSLTKSVTSLAPPVR